MTDPAIWIPARRSSTRLKDKLLLELRGQPLIAWTVQAALTAARPLRAEVRVITDCEEIAAAADRAGAAVTRVDAPVPSGTDRLALAWASLPAAQRPGLVINVQGDEPRIPPAAIHALARAAAADPDRLALWTAMIPGEATPGAVSVVTDRQGRALYFSRAAIPGLHPGGARTSGFGRHVGLYAYRGDLLARWRELEPGPLERAEGLEQLRALEHGLSIGVVALEPGIGEGWIAVDTAADMDRLRQLLDRTSSQGAHREL